MALKEIKRGLSFLSDTMESFTSGAGDLMTQESNWWYAVEWILVIVISIAVAAVIAKTLIKIRLRNLAGIKETPEIINGYALGELLGKGGFGEVKRGVNIFGKQIAIKKHHGDGWGRSRKEVSTMKRLARDGTTPIGFTELLWFESGAVGMTLLGPSLEHVRRVLPGKKFSLKTTLLVADQTLRRIGLIHSKRTVHRDIKPENFVLGLGDKQTTVHLVDFGLSERYFDGVTRSHVPYREGCTVYGTPYFSSVNADCGCSQSRRDDIESFGYMIVFLATGTLPWIGLRSLGALNSWHQRVANCKAKTPISVLTANLPSEFGKIISYARSLKYDDSPNYDYLHGLIHRRYAKLGFEADNKYDWTTHGSTWECWKRGGPPGAVEIDLES